MKNRNVLRAAMRAMLLLACLSPGLGALTLQEALDRVDDTAEVRSARLAVDSAESELHSLGFRGDPVLSLEPQIKATTREWEPFAEEVALAGGTTARLPLGMSAEEKEKTAAAADALAAARARLAQARAQAYVQVYSLYQAAWLVQAEQAVLEAEQSAARAYAEALSERFRSGEVSLLELTEAEEDLRRTDDAVLEGALRLRLSWLELAFAVQWPLSAETPALDPELGTGSTAELPRPPELVSWAVAHDPEIAALQAQIRRIGESMTRLGRPDVSPSLRAFVNVADHGASLSYAFADPLLSASYSIPLYTHGEIPQGSGSTPSWNVGAAVGISYTAGKADRMAVASLEVTREQLAAQLEQRRQGLELGIRSQYQQWLKARQSLEQARRTLLRAEENRRLLESKRGLGLVNAYDILAAEAQVKRAQWSVLASQREERIRLLGAAAGAGYLGQTLK